MNGVKEKKDDKVLTYEELAHSLEREPLGDSIKPITIKSTRLYMRVKELTEMACPTQVNLLGKEWNYFYVPLKYHGENAAIPMGIMEHIMEDNSSYYSIYFPSSELLKPLVVTEGNEQYPAVYDKVISSAAEFLPSLVDVKSFEELVPYEFRTGKIKGKYTVGEQLFKEEAEEILNEYEEHIKHIDELPMAGAGISLNDYLRVVHIAYGAVYEEVKEMSPIEAYKHLADFSGSMMLLDIKDPDSAEEFNEWLLSDNPVGSHPFEILRGSQREGISLFPPMLGSKYSRKYFEIYVENSLDYEMYLAMLKALMQEKVPVIAPQLKEILEYLTGESYLLVNRHGSEGISYRDIRPDYFKYIFKYIKWDPLEVVKPKATFNKRE